ncbi:replication endonuclease [Salmonella enterica subsp. enterica serovar Typhimurium]|uniref:Replication endonuclease n=2 Tax=Salmonella enterica TaxID=28901 RepID=A0A636RTM6_SALTM|nr:replication endonuclease [Salmonella enterica]EAA7832810.1 replication endonuclease [Salmonella enterica subsp. enterica serovar Give]EAW1490473.1 replication endonuclease [Salmonella enterica subsp. enterica]EAY2874394.1 replication endonuclease [Salmonella enterica subsp. enterica serovar Typhimurium]EBH8537690.1 replication endonuclease [Salmonella enterica subsp. enterica serovar Urbana]EBW0127453.1 replication endonuclease [Salmonella enterica subsp. enterica serovar Thompson]EBZ15714
MDTPVSAKATGEIDYAFVWNFPKQAIASPYLTYDQQYRRDRMFAALLHARKVLSLQPECVRFDVYRTAAVLAQNQGSQRANDFLISFCKKALPRLELVAKKYECVGINSNVSTAVFGGHFDTKLMQYLASRMVNMVARYNRLPDMSRADIDLLAADIANFIRAELADIDDTGFSELKTLYTWYMRAGFISLQFNVTPPHWERVTKKYVGEDEIAPAIARMFNDVWWRGRLRRIAAAWREHLQITVGNVSKKKHAYASKNCVTDWREQKRRTREFLKGLDLEDEDGNRISLIEKFDGSVANPAIRRCELMTRIRGFENICNELGYVGEFYTLTAPSKYHATTKAGYRNSKWNGASPSDTQSYLAGLWARIRAKLHREEIRIFGIRVAEPHHDGTPHWHMLMFMLPEDVERVRLIIRDYAWEEDRHELKSDKAKKARFYAEAIDPEKGSATGYVAKYISKNIDGYALDGEIDDESGELLKETAPAVSAWAARWHIRQFQFIGGAPVTVYRELRRLADTEAAHGLSVEFAAVHDAADAGDWAGYVNAQGGPFVRRDDLQVRTLYEPRTEFNQYGEETVCIRGVYDSAIGAGTPILTRLTQWKIVPKRAVDLAVDVKGAPAPSRSSVNNCTGSESDPPELDLSKPLSRREKRELTNRLRKQKPAIRRKFIHGTDEQNAAIAKTIDEIHLTTGITISRGEALHLMAGGKSCFNGKWLRGTAKGEIFTAAPSYQAKARIILNRVAALAELATKI